MCPPASSNPEPNPVWLRYKEKWQRLMEPWRRSRSDEMPRTEIGPQKAEWAAGAASGDTPPIFSGKKSFLQPSTIAFIRFSTSMYKTRNLSTSKYQNCLFFTLLQFPRRFFLLFPLSPTLIAREK